MGPESEQIYDTFIIVADTTTFDDVITKFDEHFTPEVNVIHERAVFHSRQQLPDENIETYVRALYELAEHADFPNKGDAIRDRLIVGLRDKKLSEKLQLQPALNLKDALKQARQHEQVKTQMQEQRQEFKAADAVARRGVGHRGKGHWGGNFGGGRDGASGGGYQGQSRNHGNASRGRGQRRGRGGSHSTSSNGCTRCGRTHDTDSCPARGKKCRSCSKLGHFAAVCRSRGAVHAIQAEEDLDDDLFILGSVTDKRVKNKDSRSSTHLIGKVGAQQDCSPWLTKLRFDGQDMTFKIDTGADVSVMSTTEYQKLAPRPKLAPSSARLTSPGGAMTCEGQFDTVVTHRSRNFPLRVFIVTGKTDNLLSREASSRMGLVKKIDTIEKPFGELDDCPVRCPPVKIVIEEDAQPYSLNVARRIPIPLLEKVKEELIRMERCGVIEAVDEPTDWCAGMVTVMKKSGAVRICTDFKKLNLVVKRERYMIPSLEDLLYKLEGSAIYSKLDATSGFWQLPLDPKTGKLTTFITPFGRYFYRRLPFGISSAPEIFQKTMETLLKGQKNVICYFDDILVHSADETEHETDLKNVLKTLADANLKLNKEKCVFRQKEIEFLGHRISQDGVSPDKAKIDAIINMADPTNVTELRRMLGMVNFLGRYVPDLSTILRPVTELLGKEKEWTWGSPQKKAIQTVKELLTSAPTLAFFDLGKPTIVSADASSYGIGGVILQQHEKGLKPVAYCSRTLTATEVRYAQIEKECLAAVWACERFQRYLMGLPSFTLQTDHKPLVPLINTRDLQDTPLRCQRLLIRLMRFNAKTEYTPGHKLVVADTLSRSPQKLEKVEGEEERLTKDIDAHLSAIRMSWSASDGKLEEIAEESNRDPLIRSALENTRNGWPKYMSDVEVGLREFYAVRTELSEYNGLLVKGTRIVLPQSLHKETLLRIHAGHLGITKCRERANATVWWPGINESIKKVVEQCGHCQERRPTQRKEPLMSTNLPDRPFQRVAADLCELKGKHYIILSDYFSRYLEIGFLTSLTSHAVILKLKNIFAHHGVPETIVTDNGSQFVSAEFCEFATDWGFQHVTSSPHHPQGNGQAERAVQEAKKILVQDDPFLALLAYRATPTSPTGKSPAELLFGRQIRTTLPTLPVNLEPQNDRKALVRDQDQKHKQNSRKNFDKHYGARELPQLRPGDQVLQKLDREKNWGNPAIIVSEYAPRSYIVRSPRGQFRRNRRHLRLSREYCFQSERSTSFAARCQMSCSPPSHDPTPVDHKSKHSAQYPVSPKTPSRPVPVPVDREERGATPAGHLQSGPASPGGTNASGDAYTKPGGHGSVQDASTGQPPGDTSSRSGGGGNSPGVVPAEDNFSSIPVQTTRSGRVINRPARFYE